MANHKSAIKRHKQSLKRRTRNRDTRTALRDKIKKARIAAAQGDKDAAQKLAKEAEISLAKAATKGLVHRKNAARRISRLYSGISQKTASTQAAAGSAKKPKKSSKAKVAAKKG